LASDMPIAGGNVLLGFDQMALVHSAIHASLQMQAGARLVSQSPTPTDRASAGDGKNSTPVSGLAARAAALNIAGLRTACETAPLSRASGDRRRTAVALGTPPRSSRGAE
jgi:hypothetical protein